MIGLHCVAVTPAMEIAYEVLSSFGVFLFSLLVLDLATVSIKMSEYKVLCARAVGQVFLCLGAVIACIFIFTFAIAAMSREVDLVGLEEFSTIGNIAQLLIQIAWGLTSMEQMKTIAQQSSLLFTAVLWSLHGAVGGHPGPRQIGAGLHHHGDAEGDQHAPLEEVHDVHVPGAAGGLR